MKKYDAIVIGSGAGGVVACLLAEAGKSVLLLERGGWTQNSDARDHLRNQRFSLYGHNAGPEIEGNPRVYVDQDRVEHQVRPHEGGYQNIAAAVGGGMPVYGAQAWRFMPQDFRMASTYGVPEGSSLADWPIAYDDLAPFYDRIEREMGVAGKREDAEFPLPPVDVTRRGTLLREGAKMLGWRTTPVPLLINTRPYNGRPACVQCQHCVGFPCPVDAKNGTQNTFIPRAKATGRCELITGAMAERLETDTSGRVTGVRFKTGDDETRTACAEVVVVACGAIETARLLLNSKSPAHPNGIGNQTDQVGRHLQGHYYPGASALVPDRVHDGIGPGPSTATCDFNHGNEGIIGGGMLADDFITLPIVFWHRNWPPDVPKWGLEAKRWMRENYGRFVDVKGPVQEIPSPDSRITIDPNVRDSLGIPVARLSGTTHPETVRTAAFMFERAKEWLLASGATKVWGTPPGLYLSAGQHQSGTCRMGDDPATSVVDRNCRVHGHDNLFIADGSVHVTNGGFNPVLTILALAYRTGSHLASIW